MLVLKRKPSEAIRVGDAVIRILSVKGNQVKIGVEAPMEVVVVREEVDDKSKEAA